MKMLRNENDVGLAADLLIIHYALWLHRKAVLPTKASELSELANISTAMMRCDETFTDCMQSLLSYAPSFREDYEACFVNARIMDIGDYMMSTVVLYKSSIATYLVYLEVG